MWRSITHSSLFLSLSLIAENYTTTAPRLASYEFSLERLSTFLPLHVVSCVCVCVPFHFLKSLLVFYLMKLSLLRIRKGNSIESTVGYLFDLFHDDDDDIYIYIRVYIFIWCVCIEYIFIYRCIFKRGLPAINGKKGTVPRKLETTSVLLIFIHGHVRCETAYTRDRYPNRRLFHHSVECLFNVRQSKTTI